jgi:putative PIN family toxin of toxin-antitoxin system
MRVVFDTVVYVRGLINSRSPSGRILFDFSERFTSVISRPIVSEVFDVLSRSSLRAKLPAANDIRWDRVLALIAMSELVSPNARVNVCRDPKDNKFFECAVAGNAQYIVSEDRDILDVDEFQGVKTLTASQFIDLLESPA